MDSVRTMRPVEEIAKLSRRCASLEARFAELEPLAVMVERMQESIEQLQAIVECGNFPAPIFLRWKYTTEDGCQVARSTFGKYSLDVVNGRSAISWSINKGDKMVDGGLALVHFEMAMDEAEAALRRIVQAAKA